MDPRQFLRVRGWPLASALLALALLGTLVFFGVFGRVAATPSGDGRARLLLTAQERDFVLAEMRHLLMATQGLLDAALADDMQRVAAEARKVGMADVKNIPPQIRAGLLGKLPVEFKTLGFSVHEGMDLIAADAEALGDREHTLRQLAELMHKCVACHAAYTVLPPAEAP